ncbi:MAG: hypothetical protein ABUT39_28310 [Acidobacteriota bacterium]
MTWKTAVSSGNGLGNGLGPALALAAGCLRAVPAAHLALAAGDDPLRLELPPLLDPRATGPSPAALRGLSALYLQAEMEQAGILIATEALADARAGLALPVPAAAKLEDFVRQAREVPGFPDRARLYARLFGLGPAAIGSGAAVNHAFQQIFATWCLGLLRYAAEHRPGRVPGPTREAALRASTLELVLNLAPRADGHALLAGRRIEGQLRRAIAVLSDAGVGGALGMGTLGLWQTLRRVLGDATPDLGRLIARGESGVALLASLPDLLPELQASRPGRPLLPAASPLYVHASRWLEATGLAPSAPLLPYPA